jgi:hypothetical protein
VAQQKQCLRSLHICTNNHSDLPFVVVRDYEEQLDTLLADLRAANQALTEKDKVLEKMHDISSRHEAERKQLDRSVAELQERLQVQQQQVQQQQQQPSGGDNARKQSVEEDTPSAITVSACQRAAAQLLLHVIDKRNVTAKVVAFRQWACHASAHQAVARQQHIAAVLSDQLQETQGKLKLLKRHLKKSRSHRGGGTGGNGNITHHINHLQLVTIAETSRDDDDNEHNKPSSAATVTDKDSAEWR